MTNKPTEKDVYFIRHGESEMNGKDLFQGADDPLTELGKRQASFVAERILDVDAEIILSSPMPRAAHTAEVIQQVINLPIEQTSLLREYEPPSALIGIQKSSPEGQMYIQEMLANLHKPEWHYADEENYNDMHKRAVELLDHLTTRSEHKILAVTHAGFMRALFTAMMSEGEADPTTMRRLMRFLRPMNTGVTVCHYDPREEIRNKWRLVAWNDHAHLAETDLSEPHQYKSS